MQTRVSGTFPSLSVFVYLLQPLSLPESNCVYHPLPLNISMAKLNNEPSNTLQRGAQKSPGVKQHTGAGAEKQEMCQFHDKIKYHL